MPRRPTRPAPGTPDGVSPHPEKPNLEFERKRAKRLLRALREESPEALERARRQRVRSGRSAASAGFRLADAQLMIAREYGFSSWPKLVEYFSTWERHDAAGPVSNPHLRSHYEFLVRVLMDAHRDRRLPRLGALAAFVPRFYGMTDAEILATPLTEEEAQLAVARQLRFSSWEALLAHTKVARESEEEYLRTPMMRAITARRANDREALDRMLEEHPELLDSILRNALLAELETRTPEARQITDWLASRDADLAGTLNRMLLAGPNVRTENVIYLLERGADPDWIAPSGMSVLEHALLMYWNPEAVELIARRVVPRKAFWIAAGLGDVQTMLSFLDEKGAPTDAARRDRPDFVAVGLPSSPCRPGADDLEIVWEAFLVAGMNERLAALDALLDRGFPIDYAPWGSTLLEWAEGNRKNALVDFLKERGARSGGK
jgi:hypothetical protein